MTVTVSHPRLGAKRRDLPGEQRAHGLPGRGGVVRVGELVERQPQELPLGVAEDLAERPVHAQEAAVGLGDRHPDRSVVEHAREQLALGDELAARPAQGALDRPQLGHVLSRADDETGMLGIGTADHVQTSVRAVGDDEPALELEGVPEAGTLECDPDPLAIVGMDIVEQARDLLSRADNRQPDEPEQLGRPGPRPVGKLDPPRAHAADPLRVAQVADDHRPFAHGLAQSRQAHVGVGAGESDEDEAEVLGDERLETLVEGAHRAHAVPGGARLPAAASAAQPVPAPRR